jgi:hypothetical protein
MFSGPIYFLEAELWGAEAGKAFILRMSVNFVSARSRICKNTCTQLTVFELVGKVVGLGRNRADDR